MICSVPNCFSLFYVGHVFTFFPVAAAPQGTPQVSLDSPRPGQGPMWLRSNVFSLFFAAWPGIPPSGSQDRARLGGVFPDVCMFHLLFRQNVFPRFWPDRFFDCFSLSFCSKTERSVWVNNVDTYFSSYNAQDHLVWCPHLCVDWQNFDSSQQNS